MTRDEQLTRLEKMHGHLSGMLDELSKWGDRPDAERACLQRMIRGVADCNAARGLLIALLKEEIRCA